jgi:thiamine kinase-like enzyme
MMGYRYQYIKIQGEGNRYFCIQQNPLVLAWVLFFKTNTLLPMTIGDGIGKWSLQWIKSGIRHYYSFSRTNISKLISFIKYKYHLRGMDSSVELPCYGQICVLVNKGHKIFDLRRRVAIKVYRDDVDMPDITHEMERLQKGSLFDFGPSIRRKNIRERWYEEEYIDGVRDYSAMPRNSSDLLKKFHEEIVPCLERLMLHQSPVTKNTGDYVDEIKLISASGNLKITAFIDSITGQLHSAGNVPVYLVLTHGDFCPANMLNTRHGLRVIDWESATLRSALFDFYSYFFYRAVHQKLPLDKLSSEIKAALPYLADKLNTAAPDIAGNLRSFEKLYRRLYYIERVQMLIERERYDTKHNIVDVILRFIEVFNAYEELSKENTGKLSTASEIIAH